VLLFFRVLLFIFFTLFQLMLENQIFPELMERQMPQKGNKGTLQDMGRD
jgi:hypothetical protein